MWPAWTELAYDKNQEANTSPLHCTCHDAGLHLWSSIKATLELASLTVTHNPYVNPYRAFPVLCSYSKEQNCDQIFFERTLSALLKQLLWH